jgi:hypothetical protein
LCARGLTVGCCGSVLRRRGVIEGPWHALRATASTSAAVARGAPGCGRRARGVHGCVRTVSRRIVRFGSFGRAARRCCASAHLLAQALRCAASAVACCALVGCARAAHTVLLRLSALSHTCRTPTRRRRHRNPALLSCLPSVPFRVYLEPRCGLFGLHGHAGTRDRATVCAAVRDARRR